MVPLISLELRWFFPADLPHEVDAWFREKLPGSNISTEARPDTYLYQPQHEDFGIKFRGAEKESDRKLEIKWRQFAKPYQGAHGFSGQVERWVKWGWKDPKIPLPDQDEYIGTWPVPEGPWITVDKERWQRKYGWDGSKLTPVPIGDVLDRAAVVEIANFKLKRITYGSLLIETYASDAQAQQNVLDAASTHLLKNYQGAPPRGDQSYGYPRWLASVGGKE